MLDGIVEQLMEASDAKVKVVGHADGMPVLRGSYRSNWDLSQARAKLCLQSTCNPRESLLAELKLLVKHTRILLRHRTLPPVEP